MKPIIPKKQQHEILLLNKYPKFRRIGFLKFNPFNGAENPNSRFSWLLTKKLQNRKEIGVLYSSITS
jgi:hypothetical protein